MNWFPTIIAALIIAGGAFFAARHGGKMAAKASRDSLRQTFQGQEQRDKKRQQETIQGVLQAINEELNILWELYIKNFGVYLEEVKKGGIFDVPVSISQDYFTIYRSNANLIGQIENSDLRRKVVKVYTLLQAMLDCYQINSIRLGKYQTAGRSDKALWISLGLGLANYAEKLKEDHYYLKREVEALLEMLKKELTN